MPAWPAICVMRPTASNTAAAAVARAVRIPCHHHNDLSILLTQRAELYLSPYVRHTPAGKSLAEAGV